MSKRPDQPRADSGSRLLEETGNMSALHIVGQVRLIAVDLLRATGMERERAQAAVRGAVPAPPAPMADREETT